MDREQEGISKPRSAGLERGSAGSDGILFANEVGVALGEVWEPSSCDRWQTIFEISSKGIDIGALRLVMMDLSERTISADC